MSDVVDIKTLSLFMGCFVVGGMLIYIFQDWDGRRYIFI